jgi:hypothetical protein
MQVQYDISKLETAVATKDICNDLVPQIKNNMALVMNLKDKELAAQLGMVYMNIHIYEYADTCDSRYKYIYITTIWKVDTHIYLSK